MLEELTPGNTVLSGAMTVHPVETGVPLFPPGTVLRDLSDPYRRTTVIEIGSFIRLDVHGPSRKRPHDSEGNDAAR